MVYGCYIIGEDRIRLSTDIHFLTHSASDNFVLSFKEACKKLDEKKLECLVLVDGLRNNSIEDVQEIYEIAKGYANLVYVITPIVALLQNVISSLIPKSALYNTVIVCIASSFGVITCVLKKADYKFYAKYITIGFNLYEKFGPGKMSSIPAFCLHDSFVKPNVINNLCGAFPNLIRKSFANPMEALSFGGLQKSLCIVEPGKHFEIINFTPGIFVGQEVIVEPCTVFPVTVHYSSPCFLPHTVEYVQTIRTVTVYNISTFILLSKGVYSSTDNSLINYVISYNEFGVLSVEKSILNPIPPLNCNFLFTGKYAIWSNKTQQIAVYDFQKNLVQISKMYLKFENLKNSEEFKVAEKYIDSLAGNNSILTILFDGKCNFKIIRKSASIIPPYLPLLEYCIRHFKPVSEKLIIIITTKSENKFYALSKSAESGAFLVTFIGNISESAIHEDIYCGFKNVEIIHLTESDPSTSLLFFDKNILPNLKRLRTSDLQATVFQGALMYSTLQQQRALRILPYTSLNLEKYPFLHDTVDSEDNEKVKVISKHYEIEAVLFKRLSTIDKKLFWGDLIAILIPKNNAIYAFFFVKNYQKYLLLDFDTVAMDTVLTPTILKYPSHVLVLNSEDGTLKFGKNIYPIYANNGSILESCSTKFLKARKQNRLNILERKKYRKAVNFAVKNALFDKVIFENEHSLNVQFNADYCRIIYDAQSYLEVSGDDLIPMYISFSQDSPSIGKSAKLDLDTCPQAVVYGFVELLGITCSEMSEIKSEINKENLMNLESSENPKLGFKVQTTKGFRLISPEMALAIFLQKLIAIFEKFSNQEVTKIELRRFGNKLSSRQIDSLKFVETKLKKEIVYKS